MVDNQRAPVGKSLNGCSWEKHPASSMQKSLASEYANTGLLYGALWTLTALALPTGGWGLR